MTKKEDLPKIAAKTPVSAEIEPGTYYWCACGLSNFQPYCDGTHAGTDYLPVRFSVEEKKRISLCTCKRTANPPYCDGTHKKL
ncbi:MAG TPA: CDGSH iron-sulfur domain-containing protein [Oligoflexia bacterium]|nr:CDGSH iron-sulfur domain-containing protein [Oligoflexia bacterium]